jgi:hypothetical protein
MPIAVLMGVAVVLMVVLVVVVLRVNGHVATIG